jgi:hypothetical protein
MGKTIEFKKPAPRTDLAAEVAPKLEAAKARVIELENLVAEASLAASLEEAGAANRLVQVSSQLDAARNEVSLREVAYRLALQRDAKAQAAIEAKALRAQVAEFERHAQARHEAMIEACTAMEMAAKAYVRFLDETDKMAIAMPTGMLAHAVNWYWLDTMIDGRAFPARIEIVIAGELYRHSTRFPGAAPPTEGLRLRPDDIEPASAGVRRMNEYLIGAIREKLAAIENAPLPKSA